MVVVQVLQVLFPSNHSAMLEMFYSIMKNRENAKSYASDLKEGGEDAFQYIRSGETHVGYYNKIHDLRHQQKSSFRWTGLR